MSGSAIVRALLAASTRVTALVPAARIIAGQIRQSTVLPAIGVTPVGGFEKAPSLARNLSQQMTEERVQVTVWAKSYMEAEKIVKAASLGPGVHTGIVVGFTVRAVLPSSFGPYIGPQGDDIHQCSRDFVVTFMEAN